ncbi:MAG: hypothetical protein ABIR27_07165 [Dokdonella sp.]
MFVFQSSLRPRNPLARLIGGILGLIVVAGLVVFGFFALVALFIGGSIWYLVHILRAKRPDLSQPKAAKPEEGVIDGEFTVVASADRHVRIEQPQQSEPR